MISKTSFFNKGIYKSTVKRYSWGMALYFVILFVSTGLSLFLNVGRDFSHMPYDYFNDYSVILHGAYISVPILLALVVPTVVSLLIFRFIHSKKQAIFVHSIPVSRKAVFSSSVLAGFTLMLLPVILNGGILILISLCGYGNYFTVSDCFTWMGYNILGIFMMFSCAVFAANLTGNSFAAIAINILIHAFLFITVSTLGIMGEAFIYGFSEVNHIYARIAESNFAAVVYGFMDRYFREDITTLKIIECIIASLALYTASYFLYKKRRLETATDVAGYKCLNYIFKYLVTFLATMFGFAVFSSYIGENTVVFAIIIAIISIISYAASEMVLKKTLNVFYAWKGYIGFAIVFLAITALFSLTSFFGYETRVPDKSTVKEAAIFNYYYIEEPFTATEELIDMILETHKDFVENDSIPRVSDSSFNAPMDTRLHIKYNLKNGRTMTRVYPVTYQQCIRIMNKFYENDEYTKKCEEVFIDDSAITKMYVNHENEVEDYKELLTALREDVLSLSYEELYPYSYNSEAVLYNIRIEYEFKEPSDEKSASAVYLRGIHIGVTDKYKKTVKWLSENEYARTTELLID